MTWMSEQERRTQQGGSIRIGRVVGDKTLSQTTVRVSRGHLEEFPQEPNPFAIGAALGIAEKAEIVEGEGQALDFEGKVNATNHKNYP